MQNKKIEEAKERLKYINMAYDCYNHYSRYDLYCIETILQYIDQLETKVKAVEQVRDKLECMDYYCTTEALEDLDKILQGEKGK